MLPAFHHNPQIVKAPDGIFLLFTIGQTLCAEASVGAVFQTELHHASWIEGPWLSLGCVINGSKAGTTCFVDRRAPNDLPDVCM